MGARGTMFAEFTATTRQSTVRRSPMSEPSPIQTLWNREPVQIVELVKAGLALGLALGLQLSGSQVAAIVSFLGIGLGFLTRSQVSSPATVARLKRRRDA